MSSIKKDIIIRFAIVYFLIVIGFGLVVYKIVRIQYFEGAQWKELSKQNKKEDITVYANRGNVYSCDGRLIASSIPYYKLYMDFSVDALKRDTLYAHIDSLAFCLSQKLKDKSAAEYKQSILKAYNKVDKDGRRETHYELFPKEVSYIDLQEIKKFPLFRKGQFKSGFYTKERFKRVKPFGSLASRTIGDIYGETGKGRTGIEKKCEDILTGKNGVCTRQKVAGERIGINEVDPIDGIDVITTINIDMQDIAEKALLDKLKSLNADQGCAILMEVKTGEIKAMSNLVQESDGNYYESQNIAVAGLSEPGSTFKVASMMVALEDGVVKPTDIIDTGNGIYMFGKAEMKDHNFDKGGYHKITATQVIEFSSNIGMSRIIDEHYKDNPEKFVDRLYAMKLNEKVDLDIPGAGSPYIPHPKDKTVAWDRTKLPWMSIGYNTKIPPIYTLMFYNGIANNGQMIKPIFIKSYSKNGETVKTFTTETICQSLCSPATLAKIKPMLEGVVEEGTAANVKSSSFKIAGKTGTAQINYGAKDRVGLKHQVSFCGYFPADAPLYSCIVVIRGPKIGIVSGGKMAGSVFKEIAEKVYARNAKLPVENKKTDSTSIKFPISKNGSLKQLKTVFSKFDVKVSGEPSEDNDWITTSTAKNEVKINSLSIKKNIVPSVIGMGAKDAVFLIEKLGMRVQLNGKGSVSSQSVAAGSIPVKGQTMVLTLDKN